MTSAPLAPISRQSEHSEPRHRIHAIPSISPELLRYGWISAALDLRPSLAWDWADAEDRAVRRAVMRSPELEPATAERVVATRRSGLHTLGSNPRTPIHLIAGRPGAMRRRAALDAAGALDLDVVEEAPNRAELVALGSPTIDLVLARSARLDESTADALATRPHPVVDPWVAARLLHRFGAPMHERLRPGSSRQRWRATEQLVEAWLGPDVP